MDIDKDSYVFILRGETLRSCSIDIQKEAYQNIIKHIIKPLNVSDDKIFIKIHTFSNSNNEVLCKVFKNYNVELFEVRKVYKQVKNFVNACKTVRKRLYQKCRFVMILRSDLYFFNDVDFTRTTPDNICFQWNLFHNKKQLEMADQYICVGGNLYEEFLKLISIVKIDTRWANSLHNLYNVCLKNFGEEKLSYLNYIEDPEPKNNLCIIRGNPQGRFFPFRYVEKKRIQFNTKDKGNPLYNYTRYMLGPFFINFFHNHKDNDKWMKEVHEYVRKRNKKIENEKEKEKEKEKSKTEDEKIVNSSEAKPDDSTTSI
tara:strand:+ start:2469 stop:3410 length:942 start_codon:yes stop_codon:yes gene_type:complete